MIELEETQETRAAEEYLNAPDIFYWMDDPGAADVPLRAIWIDIPTGCRFCC
jgi:hypothetical protein